jgi:aspartyl-tRNA synthetase
MMLARQPAGLLTASDAGRTVLLRGWVGRRRDLGELIFLNVRDRSGFVQILFERARSGEEAVSKAGGGRRGSRGRGRPAWRRAGQP